MDENLVQQINKNFQLLREEMLKRDYTLEDLVDRLSQCEGKVGDICVEVRNNNGVDADLLIQGGSFDVDNCTLILQDGDEGTPDIVVDLSSLVSQYTDNGDGTYTLASKTSTVIIDTNDVLTTLVDNGDGTLTYTDEAGVPNIVSVSPLVAEGITKDANVIEWGDESNTGAPITTTRYVFTDGNGVGIGHTLTVTGVNAFAVGRNNTATGAQSFVAGTTNDAIGYSSAALGFRNDALGNQSMAFGTQNTASGFSTIALGNSNEAIGSASVALGQNNTASGDRSVAMGSNTIASGSDSHTLGLNVEAATFGETVVGLNSLQLIGDPLFHNTDDFAFRVGIGATTAARADGLQVRKDGDLFLPLYPETRDDTAIVPPINVLYTGPDGHVYSAPTESIAPPNPAELEVNQVAHGLTPLTPVYQDPTGNWVPAQADALNTSEYAIVSEVIGPDDFVLLTSGGTIEVVGHGLSVGEIYFLDDAVAGNVVPAAGLSGSQVIEQPVLHAIDADTVQYFHYISEAITDPVGLSRITPENSGHVIATHDDGLGTITDIEETITSIALATNILTYTDENGDDTNIDLSLYLDDTNLARLVSGTLDGVTGVATFTRDDASTFTVDFSPLFDDTNLTRIVSGAVVGTDMILTRDDATTVVVDVTSLIQPPETITTLVDNGDNTYTYTSEDGTQTTVVAPPETITTFVDNGDGTYTYTSEDGTVTTTVAQPVSVASQIVTGQQIATHDDGAGTVTSIEETVTTLVDNGDNTYTYTAEDGVQTTVVAPPETITTFVDNGDGTYTYTSEDGTVTTTVEQPVSVATQVVTGNQIATHDDGAGTVVSIEETITGLSIAANILTYTDEAGVATDIDLSLYLDDTNLARITSGTLDAITGIATFTRDDATTFTVDLSSLLDVDTISVLTSSNTGNIIASHDDGQGNVTNIEETVTTLVDNGDNTYTYTSEDGTQTTVVAPPETITTFVDNLDGTYTYTSEDGTVTTTTAQPVSVATQVVTGQEIATHDDGAGTVTSIQETVTTLASNLDGSHTYTSEDGTQTIFSTASSWSTDPGTHTDTIPGTLIDDTNDMGLVDPGKTTIVLDSDGNYDITGIDSTGVLPWTVYTVINTNPIGGDALTLKKQNGDSLATNQFLFKDDMKIEPGEFYFIMYNPVAGGWFGLLKP